MKSIYPSLHDRFFQKKLQNYDLDLVKKQEILDSLLLPANEFLICSEVLSNKIFAKKNLSRLGFHMNQSFQEFLEKHIHNRDKLHYFLVMKVAEEFLLYEPKFFHESRLNLKYLGLNLEKSVYECHIEIFPFKMSKNSLSDYWFQICKFKRVNNPQKSDSITITVYDSLGNVSGFDRKFRDRYWSIKESILKQPYGFLERQKFLSPRRRLYVALVGAGLSINQIADLLGLSIHTVDGQLDKVKSDLSEIEGKMSFIKLRRWAQKHGYDKHPILDEYKDTIY